MTQPTQKVEDRLVNVYYCTIESCKTITPEGEVIYFANGRYITDRASHIAYLDKEIAAGHPHIHTKPGEEQMKSSDLDPMKKIKDKLRAEVLAEIAAESPETKAALLAETQTATLEAARKSAAESAAPEKLTPASTAKLAATTGKSNSAPVASVVAKK